MGVTKASLVVVMKRLLAVALEELVGCCFQLTLVRSCCSRIMQVLEPFAVEVGCLHYSYSQGIDFEAVMACLLLQFAFNQTFW